jgi:GTP cyclohydrolase I
MTVRGEKRSRARAHAEAWVGVLARDGAPRRRFEAMLRRGAAPARGGRRRRSAR